MTDALDDTGSRAVADARSVVEGWYEQLETDPAGLVDGLLLRLGQSVRHLEPDDLERLLVGASSFRGQHTEQLLGAVETGLAFLHGDGRGDRFCSMRRRTRCATLSVARCQPMVRALMRCSLR